VFKHTERRIPTDFDIERNRASVDVETFARLLKLLPPQGAFANTFGEDADFRENVVQVNTERLIVDCLDEFLDGQVDNVSQAWDVQCLQLA